MIDKDILEVGCGTGYWLREFIKWGAQPENVAGVDLLYDHITEAKHLCPDAVRLDCGNAEKLVGEIPFVLHALFGGGPEAMMEGRPGD